MKTVDRGMPFINSFAFAFVASAITTLMICEIGSTAPVPAWLLNRLSRSESNAEHAPRLPRDTAVDEAGPTGLLVR